MGTILLLSLIPVVIISASFIIYVELFKKRGKYSPFTEDFLREPGETLRYRLDTIHENIMEGFFVAMSLCLVLTLVLVLVPEVTLSIVLAVLFVLVVYYVLKLSRLFHKAVNVRLGLDGERATGQELTLLMHSGAWVFHDIPYQYGNIDHIVISSGGVFAVETKAISKPKSKTSPRGEWKVTYDGKTLKFPHRTDDSALEQARRHAKHLHRHFKKRLGIHVAVTPVVALPGWYVDRKGKSDVWVINPKERNDIRKEITKGILQKEEVDRIAADIESVARTVRPGSKRLDPDASDHYDFWNNPRYKPPSVD